MAFVKERPLPYEPSSQEVYAELKKRAQEEQLFAEDSMAFLALEALLAPNVERDLTRFKDELVESIEHELVMRMHAGSAYYEWALQGDKELGAALEWLATGNYRNVLAGSKG